jgi:hypothetical protein
LSLYDEGGGASCGLVDRAPKDPDRLGFLFHHVDDGERCVISNGGISEGEGDSGGRGLIVEAGGESAEIVILDRGHPGQRSQRTRSVEP